MILIILILTVLRGKFKVYLLLRTLFGLKSFYQLELRELYFISNEKKKILIAIYRLPVYI